MFATLRNEIKQTLYDMENNGIIRKVTDPTPWVSSLAYPRKSNGELRICLDPNYLNKTIMRTRPQNSHHNILKVRCKKWLLEHYSQLLTTFNTPFARYCFIRMVFPLHYFRTTTRTRYCHISITVHTKPSKPHSWPP